MRRVGFEPTQPQPCKLSHYLLLTTYSYYRQSASTCYSPPTTQNSPHYLLLTTHDLLLTAHNLLLTLFTTQSRFLQKCLFFFRYLFSK